MIQIFLTANWCRVPAVLKPAPEKSMLGKDTNSPTLNILSWSFFAILCVVAVSAIPLLLLTKGGLG